MIDWMLFWNVTDQLGACAERWGHMIDWMLSWNVTCRLGLMINNEVSWFLPVVLENWAHDFFLTALVYLRSCIFLNRFGYLDNLSLVGTAAEESGGYFPDILDMLEEIPVLHLVSSMRGASLLKSANIRILNRQNSESYSGQVFQDLFLVWANL